MKVQDLQKEHQDLLVKVEAKYKEFLDNNPNGIELYTEEQFKNGECELYVDFNSSSGKVADMYVLRILDNGDISGYDCDSNDDILISFDILADTGTKLYLLECIEDEVGS